MLSARDPRKLRRVWPATLLISTYAFASDSLETRILARASELLHDPARWNRNDDRRCAEGAETLSLYCALIRATEEISGTSYHRTTAMEEVRAVIGERGSKTYDHRLMGFNNDPETRLEDVHAVLRAAAQRLAERLAAIPLRSFDDVAALEPEPATSANVSAADIDDDGDVDLLLAKGRHWPLHDRILWNDGKGGFARASNLSDKPDRTYTAAIADLDGDGDLDIAVSNDRPDKKLVYRNKSGRFVVAGTFGDPSWPTRNMTLADLNDDGRPDVIAANRGAPSAVCLNDRAGRFPTCTPLPSESATSIAAADLDGDGAVDLAIPHRDSGQSHVLWNDGAASFLERTDFGPEDTAARALAVGDVDRDGLPDLVVGDEKRGVFLSINEGGRRFREMLPLTDESTVAYAIALADMNRDGKTDIVIGNVEQPGQVLLNDGTGKSYRAVAWNDGQGAVYGLAIADLDGDGWPDIAAARSDAVNGVWFNRPATR
jgi:hypothetical protein